MTDHPTRTTALPWPRRHSTPFPQAAKIKLADTQLRRNLRKATTTIRAKRAAVVGELPDWEELREAARATKAATLRELDVHLLRLEESVTAAGGKVHWARDGAEANAMVAAIARGHGVDEVVKIKSLTTDEIDLNVALAEQGITAWETDLAELIVQLGHDESSHILVPAIHKNRSEIQQIFTDSGLDPASDSPADLAGAARRYLRERFLRAKVGVSGANFAIADTGSVVVVESEGNGRMCLTLPEVLVTVMGIEKVLPTWQDLEVFLQVLPRSSTGERMNPYTSIWTGVAAGDGPQEFHLILLDNGRTRALADEIGRQALQCIRCSACLNVCPVYERVGGHAYGSVYPGPIGAIITPLLQGMHGSESLPYASSLCGACYEVCPVKIDIPTVLVHLRDESVQSHTRPTVNDVAFRSLAWIFGDRRRYEKAQQLGKLGTPFGSVFRPWSASRGPLAVAPQSFRAWWQENHR
jgi:L-lactate dehydrogenase complex protein LldF